MDDTTLMQAVRAGDARAFERLVRANQAVLVRFAARLLDDPDAGQDAAQEAFLRLWRTRARWECRGSPRAFLLRVVLNVCRDWARASRPVEALDERQEGGELPERQTQERALADAVRRAVQSLPDAQRAVFVMSHYEGLSYAEIAEALDCPLGTVASRKRLAVEALRRTLQPWAEEGEDG